MSNKKGERRKRKGEENESGGGRSEISNIK
mgnify:CR=1 FL=1